MAKRLAKPSISAHEALDLRKHALTVAGHTCNWAAGATAEQHAESVVKQAERYMLFLTTGDGH